LKNCKSAYDAELDDLMTDSAGHDVLAKRLQAKRRPGFGNCCR
jgi:hypothetical protein